MSMHKVPLTKIEEGGLKAHGLDISKPSQLSDAFRQGVAWALDNAYEDQEPVAVITPGYSICFIGSEPIAPIIKKHNLKIGSFLYKHSESSKNPYGYVREIRPGEWVFSKTCSWGPEVWKPVFLHKEEGQNCADCLDTGWLENREDGKYPCTCVTETEPYQLLKAELDTYRDIIQTNVCRVYMAVTDDKCSIENTDASVVIALFEDYLTECVEKETKPLQDEIEKLNSKLQINNTIIGNFDARCKEALAKAKLALDSCDVNDTQFPLDTQYYDRELVDEAIGIIDKLPK